jgi:hypothetical protein
MARRRRRASPLVSRLASEKDASAGRMLRIRRESSTALSDVAILRITARVEFYARL